VAAGRSSKAAVKQQQQSGSKAAVKQKTDYSEAFQIT
jgi:hypothetical protein